jgi:hypothetical protein
LSYDAVAGQGEKAITDRCHGDPYSLFEIKSLGFKNSEIKNGLLYRRPFK